MSFVGIAIEAANFSRRTNGPRPHPPSCLRTVLTHSTSVCTTNRTQNPWVSPGSDARGRSVHKRSKFRNLIQSQSFPGATKRPSLPSRTARAGRTPGHIALYSFPQLTCPDNICVPLLWPDASATASALAIVLPSRYILHPFTHPLTRAVLSQRPTFPHRR